MKEPGDFAEYMESIRAGFAMRRLMTAGAIAIGIVITGCGSATTTIIKEPGPTVTRTVLVPGPTVTKVKDVPVASTPSPTPTPTPSPTQTEDAHAGEVYCTYVRMNTADCTNGGSVQISNSSYDAAYAADPNDPGSILSTWYPLSEVSG